MPCETTPAILAPLNLLARTALLEYVDTNGTRQPLTTGTVTGFIATSKGSSAITADATLSVSASHVGGQLIEAGGTDEHPDGTWLVKIAASVLTTALLNTLFGDGATPYLIVSSTHHRVWEELEYRPDLAAELAA